MRRSKVERRFCFSHNFTLYGHNNFGGMKMTEKEYAKLVKAASPNSPLWKDCFHAFWIGGLICTIGQFFINTYMGWGVEKQDASTFASMTLVALSALLTGLSWYDDIAKHAGAGTLVPITGFANAVAAPAVEFQTEGFILGTAAKMFTIAGPVIVYGLVAGVVYGVIYWIYTLVM
jgi:stage V sporulation protein AC